MARSGCAFADQECTKLEKEAEKEKSSSLPKVSHTREYAIWKAIDQAWKDTLRVSLHEKWSKKHRSSICEPTVGFFLMKVLVYLYHPGPTSICKHTFPPSSRWCQGPKPSYQFHKARLVPPPTDPPGRVCITQVIPTFGWMIIWSLYWEWSFQNLDPKWVIVTGMILETMQIDWCLKLEGNSTLRPVLTGIYWDDTGKFYWCFNIIPVSSRYIYIYKHVTDQFNNDWDDNGGIQRIGLLQLYITMWLPWTTWAIREMIIQNPPWWTVAIPTTTSSLFPISKNLSTMENKTNQEASCNLSSTWRIIPGWLVSGE